MSKVSIVIPCYNAARFVHEAVGSALAQTYPDTEIICVDDGSADATLAILQSLAAEYDQVRVIAQANQGATAARNRGLQDASGEYIQFLDADDRLHPDKIACQMSLAEGQNRPGLVIGSYAKFDAKGQMIFERLQEKGTASPWLLLMQTRLGITSANLFLRDQVRAVKGWDESLKSSQEYDLMFRMMVQGTQVAYAPEMHTEVLQRDTGSITSSSKGDNWLRYIELRLRMREHIVQHGLVADTQAVHQVLFDAIRLLYPYDPAQAKLMFKNEIPAGFKPQLSPVTSASYLRLYGLLGFKLTEGVRALKA